MIPVEAKSLLVQLLLEVGVFNRMRLVSGLVIGVLLFLAGTTQAMAWWNDDWKYRQAIPLSAGDYGVGTETADVPVLIRLHQGNFDFDQVKADGSDIRFVGNDDQTPIKFHIERFDPVDAIGLIWVRASRLEQIWMYYGNEQAPGAQDPKGTYDPSQILTLHFSETKGNPKDVTVYNQTPARFSGGLGLPSVIGNGLLARGRGDIFVIPAGPSVDLTNGFTFSTWIKLGIPQQDAYLASVEGPNGALQMGVNGLQPYLRLTNNAGTHALPMTSSLTAGTWHHVAGTIAPSGDMAVYLDGQPAGAASFSGNWPELKYDLALFDSAAGGHALDGEIDEVQVASVARPQSYLQVNAKGQGPEGVRLALGDIQENEGGSRSSSYMTVVAQNISVDGWAIIGLLLSFGAVCGVVFINKALAYRQMNNENRIFLHAFRNLDDPLALDGQQVEYPQSPIYRIYADGVEDIKGWMSRHTDVEKPEMCHKALNTFKTVLENAYMLENKRINSGLIVLAMGISGGPFLGLLGTVWGVMNTFAAMALSGEANLAAIAPGIASALATTVFGLVVAIPALFAYNYLASNVKSMVTDLGMFVDQFSNMADHTYGKEEL